MERKYYFIVNTHSKTGGAAKQWDILKQRLDFLKVDYEAYITEYVHHGIELAKKLTEGEEVVNLVVCGGDGTVNEVLNGITDLSKVNFGYIPLGSANDFARGLEMTGEPIQILDNIIGSDAIDSIDVGLVQWDGGSRRFIISAGAGIDAAVCREAQVSKLKNILNKIKLGGATYGLLTVKNLFTAPLVNGNITFADGRTKRLNKIIFGAAMNFSCEGGGVPMAPKADARDGKLSMCMVSGLSKLICLMKFPLLLMAKHEKIVGFDIIDSESFTIEFDRPMVVHADGEDCGDIDKVTFRCLPKELKMIK
ncbi:MAG: diacylglycerol kinase family lipid kinase [Lachnospiraceae bacterium]|nr:diacylglycerol kinase family lipid kinase [Lachnospiraceae bacterium]